MNQHCQDKKLQNMDDKTMDDIARELQGNATSENGEKAKKLQKKKAAIERRLAAEKRKEEKQANRRKKKVIDEDDDDLAALATFAKGKKK